MTGFSRWTAKSTALLALGLTTVVAAPVVAPIVMTAPASAAELSDVRDHWARPFIEKLADENIITGFPDGTYKPNQAVTRAQFAAIVRKAFNKDRIRSSRGFADVSSNYWAASAIDAAYETGFLSGYPNNQFRPDEQIPRVQVLVSLSSGLTLKADQATASTLGVYADARQIPTYATEGVAAATEDNIVVNYPNVSYLNPNDVATRAEVAAFVYQALVKSGRLQPLATQIDVNRYIVKSNTSGTNANTGGQPPSTGTQTTQNPELRIAQGTKVNVKYEASDKVVVAPGESINMTVTTASDIKNSQGKVLVPANSRLEGQLIPRYSGSTFLGTQFVAQRLLVGTQTYNNLNVTSPLVTAKAPEEAKRQSLEDTAITAAARTIADTVLGRSVKPADILTTILTGRTPGTTPTTNTQNQLVIIDPETDLPLTFGSDFYLSAIAGS
ncbi:MULTISPECIES: S-layer homology domain-containing protein [Trichocoleus]|uniref:S-layer homology domain-containing protein n=1 Tax=Trichocoleus desertorum GB2-A4 TaxID=2933944 RepID=A0ABV0JDQ6_9CYAN|nr:S-layer homology domain-containing protein [Trichocoleus sp. FACHB-46]MBD1864428.1 S-layer homology domain-containing protein [Trichocoleus sp. FACHB-46]